MSGVPEIPVGEAVERGVRFLLEHFQGLFDAVALALGWLTTLLEAALLAPPPGLLAAAVVGLALWRAGWRLALFAALALVLVLGMGLWRETVATLVLVLAATLVSLALGLPVGIATAKSRVVDLLVRPVLDLMQTLPAFVYLIPAAMFFGLGTVPGTVATITFAMPPAVRLTGLGIRQVPRERVEAGLAFGCTPRQLLFKVEVPSALPSIMAGVNQTVMLSLSMVVIASMIGAGGLGNPVLRGIQRLEIGTGFEGGIAVVILAVLIDRITQSVGARRRRSLRALLRRAWARLRREAPAAALLLALGLLPAAARGAEAAGEAAGARAGPPLRIGWTAWADAEFVTHLAARIVESRLGQPVELVMTDIGLQYQGVATGELDAMLMAWLPTTHAPYWKRFAEDVVNLGPLYTRARIGWAVPAYVPEEALGSIEDLASPEVRRRLRGQIYGIDPGAGLMRASEGALEAYGLAEEWRLVASSGAAMTVMLERAIRRERWVVVTAWSPHWMFQRWELRYLRDPKGALGGIERVHALVRRGFEGEGERAQAVTELLARMFLPLEELETMMGIAREESVEAAVDAYLERHPARVDYWVTGELP